MSVVMRLLRPITGVEFEGFWWMKIDEDEFDYFYDMICSGEEDKAYKEIGHIREWSDGKEHYFFDLNNRRGDFQGCRNKKRMMKKLHKFETKTFTNEHVTIKYIPFDEIEYWQGWQLKQKFFKRKHWHNFCTTKKEMEAFFDKYMKKKDPIAKDAIKTFLDAWEDGMLFECWW